MHAFNCSYYYSHAHLLFQNYATICQANRKPCRDMHCIRIGLSGSDPVMLMDHESGIALLRGILH